MRPERGRSQRARRDEILDGPVGPVLARLAVPMVLGIASSSFSGAIDAYFIGKLGSRELAAYGFSFPVSLVLNNLIMGLGIGTASLVSRTIGEGRPERIRQVTTHAFWMGLAVALILAGLGSLTLDPLFRQLGATPDVLPLIRKYMTVWYAGLPLLLLPMIGNNAVRATGDTRTPSLVLLGAAAMNVLLDPLLIFGWGIVPRLELAGAALAGVLSQGVTLAVLLFVLVRREGMLEPVLPRLRDLAESSRRIGAVAVPAAMTRIVFPLSMLLITGLVATHGPEAVGALAVAARIESLVMIVVVALAASLLPFVGQNWGAGRPERARQGFRASLRFAVLWGLAVSAVLFLGAPWVARLFADDPRVVAPTVLYLRIVSWSLAFQGISALAGSAFNAVDRALYSTAITLARMFALYVPLAYLGSYLWGLPGIFAGACAANVLVGLGSLAWSERFFAAATAASQRGRGLPLSSPGESTSGPPPWRAAPEASSPGGPPTGPGPAPRGR